MASNRLTDQQIANAAKAGGWAGNDIAIAVAVALAESGGYSDITSPPNHNGSVDRGLWQVNSIHGYPPSELLTVTGNARAAHAVWASSGWKAWSTYKSGAYLVYLARGRAVAGTASDTGGGSGDGVTKTQDPLAFFTDAATWRRFAMFVMGFVLIIFALFKLTGDNKISGTTKAIVTKAVVK